MISLFPSSWEANGLLNGLCETMSTRPRSAPRGSFSRPLRKPSQTTPASEESCLLPHTIRRGAPPMESSSATPGGVASATPHAPGSALPTPLPEPPLPATGQITAPRSPPNDEPLWKKAKLSGRQKVILRDKFAMMSALGAEPIGGLLRPRQ
jgi:hypothetical protein